MMLLLILSLRVVSLAPSLTEMVLFLGKASLLVGVTVHDTFRTVAGLPRVGGFARPDFEALVRLQPDLVLLTHTQEPLFRESLAKLRLPYRVISTARLGDLLSSLDTLSRLFQASEGKELRARLDSLLVHLHGFTQPVPVLIVVSRAPGSLEGLYVAGQETFYSDLFSRVGLVNVVRQQGYVPLDLERALDLSPRWILDITGDRNADLYAPFRPDSVLFLPPDPYLRPGLCALWHFGTQWGRKSLFSSIPCPPSAATAR